MGASAQLPVTTLHPCPAALLSATTEQMKLLFHKLTKESTRADRQGGKNSGGFLTLTLFASLDHHLFKSRAGTWLARLKYKGTAQESQLKAEGSQ